MALSVAQYSLVTATKIPEFLLTADQTKLLAEAAQKVTRHFPSVLTQKQQDIMSLVACVGAIGFTQFQAYANRRAREKQERENAGFSGAMPQ
jgi:hypothetical protein